MARKRKASIPEGYPAVGARSYPAFRKALAASGCKLCPLSKGRTRIVVDRGEPAARILVVGEGPGADEDRLGLAFVGRSGRLLDEMLLEAGLDPTRELLIANVVKCRPPDNRPPKQDEADRCLPYLRRQVELVGPRLVILLGRTAVKYLIPEESRGGLSSRVGRFFLNPQFPGAQVMITFHPAFILRNRSRRPEMVRHLARAADRLEELKEEGIPAK